MADEVVRQDRMFLGEDVEGVCVRHLPLDDDAEFRALETKRATYKSCGSRMGTKAIKDLEDQLGDRAAELARTAKKELRNLLGTEPLGVPLSDLPIDVDGRFRALEDNYRDLSRNSANGGKLCEIILQLNERALELAAELHTKERVVLSQCPGGIPLSALALNEDEMFKALEMEARKLRHSTAGRGRNAARISELESAMNERAMELANQLRRTYCDAAPEGIPLELLGLGGVEEFTKLEDALRDATKDPVKNREIISDIEFELNSRAHVAATGLLEGDRDYLECETMEVPLSDLPLNTDSVFRALEVERAVLKLREPHRGARRVRELELKLVERAHRLAEELKEEDLSGLDGEPEGVSLRALKPHNDSLFSEFVGAMRELKRGPKRNTVAIEELRERMNERAHELAQEKLKDDREFLDQCPEGVPLSDLPLGTDPLFHKLETERARLKERDAARNITHIHELESRLKDRAVELANEQKGRDLSELEQSPCGVPIYILQLHDDPVLQKMLNKMRGLRNRGVTGPEFVALIDEINNCARDAAEELLLRDREYLEPEPLGVPLSLLSLTTDTVFHGLEVQRAVLKAQNARRNAAKISDFEMRLNERAVQLAEVQRQRELEGLDPEPEGIPISVLNPHGDAEFIKLVTELRQLCSEGNNEGMCDVLKTTMNDVVHALAKRLKEGDRGYLDPEPEGVPLCVLPLDTDVLFFRLECERVTLKARNAHLNARRICELEDALNNRAVELAREQLRQDVDGVDEAPCGIPLQLLRLHEDSTFLVMVDDIRTLRKNPDANSEAIDAVVMSMNDRAYDVAIAQFDRGFLDPEPEGVPLCILPLDDDELFHGMEVERIKLKLTDARRNAQTIGTLEEEMNGRAHELALQQLREELSGIDAAPEGIPLSLLRVMEDPAFALMVLELRDLKKDTQGNAERIREVEDAMNNRAYELADGLLEGDRSYLDPIPLGVPVSELPLCSDEPFATMEVERARLKAEDARRNAAGIGELELKLNNRAKELASEQLLRDLEGFHDEYEGIDLVHLRPHDDKEFASLVPELRRLKRDGDKEAVEQHMRSMDRRLRELAKELVGGDLWFLDKEPEGVPLTYLPLDGDEILDKLRHERAQLKIQDPRGNADRIAELERKMNERIHDLAKCIGDEDFDGVEGEPCGIPLSLLSPRDDEVVAKLINDIRKVKYSTEEKSSNGALNNLQVELSKRVHQLAEDVLIRDRVKYLNQCPESVDISFLPLSTDEQFRALELERVIINIQSNGDDKRLDGLEDMLNKRAHELAKEQLQEDLRGLEQAPHGVPLDVLKPHSDLRFIKEAEQLRNLKRDPLRNKREIDDLVEQMNNTVGEIALNLLRSDRDYLHLAPEGVPIEVLPLEVDAKFLLWRRSVQC
ncbi:calpain [Trypanosoma brucei equiperdum]|uniref:Calpain n=1 Tax=Trypanosoma brucei equiperdum TaxID=630700 RepID=A0A3L6KWF4_9TRYP|nr:calpain [Trypanosoma brucei equiperdum]